MLLYINRKRPVSASCFLCFVFYCIFLRGSPIYILFFKEKALKKIPQKRVSILLKKVIESLKLHSKV